MEDKKILNTLLEIDKQKYLIPRAVRTRLEIFPGFGVSESMAVGIGFIVGFAVQHLLSLLSLPNVPLFKIIALTLFTAVPYFAVKPDIYGNTLWKQIKDYRNWSHSQRKYLYKKSSAL